MMANKRHLEASWRRLGGVLEASWAVLGRERSPTWLQLGTQNRAKTNSKSIPKLIKFLVPLGIDFWKDFGGFWEAKQSQVGTKIHKKLASVAKVLFLKKPCFSLGKTYILKVRGVQVASKNRLKIEAKINQFLKASWDLIFMGFWWILEGKWSQVGTQMASKIDANFEG